MTNTTGGQFPAILPAVSGVLTNVNDQVACDCRRAGSASIALIAASGLTGHVAAFEASPDSTDGVNGTWFGIQAVRSNANTVETACAAQTGVPAYCWDVSANGYNWLRVRCTAITGGSATWRINPSPLAADSAPGVGSHAVTLVATNLAGSAAVGPNTYMTPLVSVASTNATSVKATGGTIFSLTASNVHATDWRWLKLYDKTSPPVVGTDTPVEIIGLPPKTTFTLDTAFGSRFSTGIALALTALPAISDTTAVGAGDVVVSMCYM